MPSSRFLLERTQPKVHGDWLTVQIIVRKRKQEDNCQTVLIFQCKPFSHSEVSSTSLLTSCHSATSVSQNKISLLTDTRNISIQKMPLKFSFQQVMRTDAIHNWLQWEAQYVNSNNFWTAWGSKEVRQYLCYAIKICINVTRAITWHILTMYPFKSTAITFSAPLMGAELQFRLGWQVDAPRLQLPQFPEEVHETLF